MISTSSNSLLHLDLFDLRMLNDVAISKYKKVYGYNEVYRIFVKTLFIGQNKVVPLYFDFTDMVIRYNRKELEILDCHFEKEYLVNGVSEFLRLDYKYMDWYKLECDDIEKYRTLYKTLEDLSCIVLPRLKMLLDEDKMFTLNLANDIFYDFDLNTDVLSPKLELSSVLGGFLLNDEFIKTEDLTAYRVLDTLFKTNQLSFTMSILYSHVIRISTFTDPSYRVKVETVTKGFGGDVKLVDNTLEPFISLRNQTEYSNSFTLDGETKNGSRIIESMLNWLLELGRLLKGSDTPAITKLLTNLNDFISALGHVRYSGDTQCENMITFVSNPDNLIKLFLSKDDEEDKYRYNGGGLELSIPVDELKDKLVSVGKSGDIVTAIPGRYRTDKSIMHGIIFIDSDYKYGFFDCAKDVIITDIFKSNFDDVEDKENTVEKLFAAIRKLNVKKYWFTLVNTEEDKGLQVCDKYIFGFVSKLEETGAEDKIKHTLTAITLKEFREKNDSKITSRLQIENLTSESLKKYIASRLLEIY